MTSTVFTASHDNTDRLHNETNYFDNELYKIDTFEERTESTGLRNIHHVAGLD